jgi:formate-dependent phosphoribosylglycinamide formyltransferase (GAR transformylase)
MLRNVIFVAPFATDVTMRFVRAASKLPGVRLLGIVHTPPGGKDAKVFHDVVRVTDPLSAQDISDATKILTKRHGKPHRLIGILESLMVQLGEVREHLGIHGTGADVADRFRDKANMKAALAKAGLPVARNMLIRKEADLVAFAKEVGFPMVVKPPAGMGARSTHRVHSVEEGWAAARGMGAGPKNPVLAEEFLRGREFSFETITIGGVPRASSISHYLPSCLEAVENPWIKWCCMLPRDVSGHEYDGIRKIGRGAIEALGLDDGMTHMEWFQRPDGSLVIGEIAQRPPGANISIMTSYAYDTSIYKIWSRAIIDGVFDDPWDRKYAVGTAFLRGMGSGRVANVNGLGEIHKRLGKMICEAKIPEIGERKADGYEGEGYIVVRDPSTKNVQKALKQIIETVHVGYA